MLYRPEKGAMWDPTLWYEPKDNKFYMLSMHYKDERDGGTGLRKRTLRLVVMAEVCILRPIHQPPISSISVD